MTTDKPRVHAGVPSGGEFAATAHSDNVPVLGGATHANRFAAIHDVRELDAAASAALSTIDSTTGEDDLVREHWGERRKKILDRKRREDYDVTPRASKTSPHMLRNAARATCATPTSPRAFPNAATMVLEKDYDDGDFSVWVTPRTRTATCPSLTATTPRNSPELISRHSSASRRFTEAPSTWQAANWNPPEGRASSEQLIPARETPLAALQHPVTPTTKDITITITRQPEGTRRQPVPRRPQERQRSGPGSAQPGTGAALTSLPSVNQGQSPPPFTASGIDTVTVKNIAASAGGGRDLRRGAGSAVPASPGTRAELTVTLPVSANIAELYDEDWSARGARQAALHVVEKHLGLTGLYAANVPDLPADSAALDTDGNLSFKFHESFGTTDGAIDQTRVLAGALPGVSDPEIATAAEAIVENYGER
jgi:hypothetical protein